MIRLHHQNKTTTRRTAKARQTPTGDKMLGFDKTLHSNMITYFFLPVKGNMKGEDKGYTNKGRMPGA